ncbi:hypothetical protein ROBYS_40660 [Roseobacter sp. OBYS 0001]|nr:hypothetical protein ROBYS_40660 [Roseobacter sp. OBYS 0001]
MALSNSEVFGAPIPGWVNAYFLHRTAAVQKGVVSAHEQSKGHTFVEKPRLVTKARNSAQHCQNPRACPGIHSTIRMDDFGTQPRG